MPAPIPLRIRIPIEYAVTMGIGAAIAWLYSTYAMASFILALVLGLSMVLGVWVVMQFLPKTRGKGIHILTAAAIAVTIFVLLKVA